MPKKRFRPKEIIGKLCRADVQLGWGKNTAEIVKVLAIADVISLRWRHDSRGMNTAQTNRLKEPEMKNGRLRKLVADLTLDTLILQKSAKGDF